MVVSGFRTRLLGADEDRSFHAGKWRLINEAMDQAPAAKVEAFKIKAHKNKEQIRQEEMEHFLCNEEVDLLAKQAATDRVTIALMDLAEAELTGQLFKARRVVEWLADQVCPDRKDLGEAPGVQFRRPGSGLRLAPRLHVWVWSGSSWRCRYCGKFSLSGSFKGGCPGSASKAKMHRRHVVRDGWLGSGDGPPFSVCMLCACTRAGGNGLQDRGVQ